MSRVVAIRRVRVSGPSMVPTLHDRDVVLVWIGAPIRSGDVVLARFRELPGRPVLKRAVAARDGGWWLASDNEFVDGDSRSHGVAEVSGRVLLRWTSSGGPIARLRPRRVR
jgi:phage repressor protein C with HTH and peptisase S24 domain